MSLTEFKAPSVLRAMVSLLGSSSISRTRTMAVTRVSSEMTSFTSGRLRDGSRM